MSAAAFATTSAWSTAFTLSGGVTRRAYLAWGFGLAVLKYAVEAIAIGVATGLPYSPMDFLTPLLSHRARYTAGGPAWLGPALLIWSLPFVWISLTMSIRRCRDAGLSPWAGLILLLPLINFIGMFLFSVFPSKPATAATPETQPDPAEQQQLDTQRQIDTFYHVPQTRTDPAPGSPIVDESGVLSGFLGIAAGGAYAILSTVVAIYGFQSYGTAVFFGTPLISGAVGGYVFNRSFSMGTRRSIFATVIHATAMVTIVFAGMLVFGFEGAICLLMAAPIIWPITIMGALIGRSICVDSPRPDRDSRGMMWCMTGLPLLASLEHLALPDPVIAVTTSVEISASPEDVWDVVIAFPEITAPPGWLFRTGIAYPVRARIDGSGVGAIRHCEFSTGAFVEPITDWDRPRRLAFDVSQQPEPMFELTPYRHIHPPHLTGSFRSERGEFRLVELPDGRTRLSGTTWYTVNIHPQTYWTIWTDILLHRIHARVLDHIKVVVEGQATVAEKHSEPSRPVTLPRRMAADQ